LAANPESVREASEPAGGMRDMNEAGGAETADCDTAEKTPTAVRVSNEL